MESADRPFRFGLVPVLITSLLAVLFLALGLWQLDRAEQKRELYRLFELGGKSTLDAGALATSDPESLKYEIVTLNGRYDPDHQFLLDNMIEQGQSGYQVLTALRLPYETTAVLVNRGWVPADPRREILPEIRIDELPRLVSGRVDPELPRPGLRIEGETTEEWPRVVQFPSIEELETMLGYPLFDFQVLLDPTSPDGFVREWKPRGMGPARHLAYAVQWFALAIAAVVIVVVLGKRIGARSLSE